MHSIPGVFPNLSTAKIGRLGMIQHVSGPKNLKGGIGSLFDPCVNAKGWQPYWPSYMEVSYCTFGFAAVNWRDLRKVLLLRKTCRDLSPCRKGNSRLMKLLGGLSYEKIRRYNNSPPYVTARWPPQQIPPFNFLDQDLPAWASNQTKYHQSNGTQKTPREPSHF